MKFTDVTPDRHTSQPSSYSRAHVMSFAEFPANALRMGGQGVAERAVMSPHAQGAKHELLEKLALAHQVGCPYAGFE